MLPHSDVRFLLYRYLMAMRNHTTKAIRTFDRRLDKLRIYFNKLSGNGRREFFVDATKVKARFGKRYNEMVNTLVECGDLRLTRPHVAPWYDDHGNLTRKGQCRYFALGRLTPVTEADHQVPATPEAIEFRQRYNTTNLAALGVAFTHTLGKNGDARVYHSGTSAPKTLWAQLTINGEATVDFDFANLFPALMAAKVGEASIRELSAKGQLYGFIAEGAGVSIAAAKVAVAKGMNARRMVFATFNEATQRYEHAVDGSEGADQRKAWQFVQVTFPVFAKAVRQMAREKGASYRLCAKSEARIRVAVLSACEREGIVAIDRHDSFAVPESQADAFQVLVDSVLASLGVALTIRKKFTCYSTPLLTTRRLICTNSTGRTSKAEIDRWLRDKLRQMLDAKPRIAA